MDVDQFSTPQILPLVTALFEFLAPIIFLTIISVFIFNILKRFEPIIFEANKIQANNL